MPCLDGDSGLIDVGRVVTCFDASEGNSRVVKRKF